MTIKKVKANEEKNKHLATVDINTRIGIFTIPEGDLLLFRKTAKKKIEAEVAELSKSEYECKAFRVHPIEEVLMQEMCPPGYRVAILMWEPESVLIKENRGDIKEDK